MLKLGIDKQSINRLKSDSRSVEQIFTDLDRVLLKTREEIASGVGETDPTKLRKRLSLLQEEKEHLESLSSANEDLIDIGFSLTSAHDTAVNERIKKDQEYLAATQKVREAILAGEDPKREILNLKRVEAARKEQISLLIKEEKRVEDLAKATRDLEAAKRELLFLEKERASLQARGIEAGAIGERIEEVTGRAVSAREAQAAAAPARRGLKISREAFDNVVEQLGRATQAAHAFGIEFSAIQQGFLDTVGLLDQVQMDPVSAGISAVGLAFQEFKRQQKGVKEGIQEVDKSWTGFTERQIRTNRDAVSAAKSYEDAQNKIQEVFEMGGVIADAVLDKRRMTNAAEKDLQRLLAGTAKNYDDYTQAVQYLNENLKDGERIVTTLNEAEFKRYQLLAKQAQASVDLAIAVEEGWLTLEEIRRSQGGAQLGIVVRRQTAAETAGMDPEQIREESGRMMEQARKTILQHSSSLGEAMEAIDAYNASLGKHEKAIVLTSAAEFRYTQAQTQKGQEIQKLLSRWSPTAEQVTLTTQQAKDQLDALIKKYEEQGIEVTDLKIKHDELTRVLKLEKTEATRGLVDAYDEYLKEIERAQKEYTKEAEATEKELIKELKKTKSEWALAENKIAADAATDQENIAAKLADDIVSLDKRTVNERLQVMTSYASEAAEAEVQYYQERADAAASYGLETQRMEEDHQKEMRRMREDSEERQRGAIRSRDALALRDERRSYGKERGRAEEDYGIDAARRSQDFAIQIAQMEQAFREQEAERLRNYEKQLVDLQVQIAKEEEELKKAAEEESNIREEQRVNDLRIANDQKVEAEITAKDSAKTQLGILDKSLTDQETTAKASYDKQRQDLGFWTEEEWQTKKNHYNNLLAQTQAWANDNAVAYKQGLPRPPIGLQAGGYALGGIRRVGEQGREFMLSNAATTAAERMMGGQLTQQGLLAMMAAGQSGGSSSEINFNQQVTITDARDPQKVAEIVRRETWTVLDELTRRAR